MITCAALGAVFIVMGISAIANDFGSLQDSGSGLVRVAQKQRTQGAASASQPKEALIPVLTVSPDLSQLRDGIVPIFEVALNLVRANPPRMGRHLFLWSQDRRMLKGKKLTFILSTSNDSSIPGELRNLWNSKGHDAVTFASPGKRGEVDITVIIFADKLELTKSGIDSFSKLVVTLAHEIFGHVQDHLESQGLYRAKDKKQYVDDELRAYDASISFVESLLQSDLLKGDKQKKVKDDFSRRLEDEKKYRAIVAQEKN
jgi:hypothetical protein